jgi:hypothetical protein
MKTEQTIKLATKFQIMVNWWISYKIKLEQKQIVISHKRKTADEETKMFDLLKKEHSELAHESKT